MKHVTHGKTLAGKAFNVALAVALAFGLTPPVRAFGSDGVTAAEPAAGEQATTRDVSPSDEAQAVPEPTVAGALSATETEAVRDESSEVSATDAVEGEQTDMGGPYTARATGVDNLNYALPSEVSTTFTNGRARLTVKANDKAITYGEEPASDGVTYSGFVAGDDESSLGGTLAFSYDYEQYGDVGSYAITPSGLTSDNYDIVFETGLLTVNPKQVVVQWGEVVRFTYNGQPQAPTATVNSADLVNGDTCEVTISGAEKDIGGYHATASGLTNKNYVLWVTQERDFSIGQKEIGLSWADTELPYTGSPQKPTATATGLVEGDVCEVTVTGEQTEVGGPYTAMASRLSNLNYRLPSAATQDFRIVPADKGGLDEAIKKAEEALNPTGGDDPAGMDDPDVSRAVSKLRAAVDKAKETSSKENPTKGEVDEAEAAVMEAQAELERAVDDKVRADEATGEMNDLPAPDKVTADDRDAIEAARAAYDALTDVQKAKVSPDALKRLEAAEAAVKDAKIVYAVVRGEGGSWTKGGSDGLEFAFKRNVNDERTIDTFSGLRVDGVEVPKDGYTAVAGFVVITLSPAYLETLSAGDHELTATFADGDDVAVGFKVLEAPASGEAGVDGGTGTDDGSAGASAKAAPSKAATPKTGDVAPLALSMSCAALGLVALVASRRRERGSVRDKRNR